MPKTEQLLAEKALDEFYNLRETYNDTDCLPPAPHGWEWEYNWDKDIWYLKKPNHRSFRFELNGYWEQSGGWNFGKTDTRVHSFWTVFQRIGNAK